MFAHKYVAINTITGIELKRFRTEKGASRWVNKKIPFLGTKVRRGTFFIRIYDLAEVEETLEKQKARRLAYESLDGFQQMEAYAKADAELTTDLFESYDDRCGDTSCLWCYGTQEEYEQGHFNNSEEPGEPPALVDYDPMPEWEHELLSGEDHVIKNGSCTACEYKSNDLLTWEKDRAEFDALENRGSRQRTPLERDRYQDLHPEHCRECYPDKETFGEDPEDKIEQRAASIDDVQNSSATLSEEPITEIHAIDSDGHCAACEAFEDQESNNALQLLREKLGAVVIPDSEEGDSGSIEDEEDFDDVVVISVLDWFLNRFSMSEISSQDLVPDGDFMYLVHDGVPENNQCTFADLYYELTPEAVERLGEFKPVLIEEDESAEEGS